MSGCHVRSCYSMLNQDMSGWDRIGQVIKRLVRLGQVNSI
jgi:hypothetical protein